MKIAIITLLSWAALSIPICYLFGRFVRIGMVELQPEVDHREQPL